MPRGEGLRPRISRRQGARHGNGRQRSASEIGSVAIGALGPVTVRIVAMLAHPSLIDVMHAVWTAVQRGWSTQMADRAFNDLARVTLQIGAVYIVVGLQTGVFRVL